MASLDHHLSPEAKCPKPTGLKKPAALLGGSRGGGVPAPGAGAPAQPAQGEGEARCGWLLSGGTDPGKHPRVTGTLAPQALGGHTLEPGEGGMARTERIQLQAALVLRLSGTGNSRALEGREEDQEVASSPPLNALHCRKQELATTPVGEKASFFFPSGQSRQKVGSWTEDAWSSKRGGSSACPVHTYSKAWEAHPGG